MDGAAWRHKLELQARVLEGRRAAQELAELQRGEQQLNNISPQYLGQVQQQSGPSRVPSANANSQLNMQQVDLASLNAGHMQADPQWQALAYAQLPPNYGGAMHPYNMYHNPNSIPHNNPGSINIVNANSTPQANPHSQQSHFVRQAQNVISLNSAASPDPHSQQAQVVRQNSNRVPAQSSTPAQNPLQQQVMNPNSMQRVNSHPQQAQLVRQTQNRGPIQSSTVARNPLQQQLDAMTQAYARNADAAYVPPGVESNVQHKSVQQAHEPSHDSAPHNDHAISQAHHYRPHVYKAAGAVAAPTSGPSQSHAQTQASQGTHAVASSPIHSNGSPQQHHGTPAVTSPLKPTHLNEPPQRPPTSTQVQSVQAKPPAPNPVPPSQLQPALQRPPHQPQPQRPLPHEQRQHHLPQPQGERSSSSTGPATGPEPHKERVVDIPSWSMSLLNNFKQQCYAYFETAPVGATMDVYAHFQFAKGFVFQRQYDGLWLVDTRDNMKAPLKQLIGELESRQVPDDAPGAWHSFGTPAVANTARPSIGIPQLPPHHPPSNERPFASSSGPRATNLGPRTENAQPPIIRIPAGVRVSQPAAPHASTPQGNWGPLKPSVPVRSPADANRRTLAKDILYALGKRNRPAAEPDVGPDPKRPLMHAVITGPALGDNAPAMSAFRVNVAAQGGVIDLSQLPVLPAAPAKPYKPAFAGSTSNPISSPTTAPSTPALPPPQAPANQLEVAVQKLSAPVAPQPQRPLNVTTPSQPPLRPVVPLVTTSSQPHAFPSVTAPSQPLLQASQPLLQASQPLLQASQPLLQAPQPRTAIPGQLHEALLAPPSTGGSPQPVASSSDLGVVGLVNSASVPPIATIANFTSLSDASTTPHVVDVQPGKKDNSAIAYTPGQTVTRQYGKKGKGKGRASSVASDATSQLPLSRSSSKTSQVPPTSSSPGASMVLGIISPSPRPVSRAASEAEPLFLPSDSPPQSPVLGAGPLVTPDRAKVGGGGVRRQLAYVLIPTPSPRTQRFMQKKRQESSVPESSRAPTSSRRSSSRATSNVAGTRVDHVPVSPFTGEDVEYDYSFDQHGNSIEDPVERRLLELACTRMQAVECKWDRCPFVANSPISLLAHYKKHHRPPLRNGTPDAFSCQWTQCGKRCRFQEIRHFIKHALDSLTCPYSDCQERFRTVGKLRRHVEKHADGSPLKPGCALFRPLDLTPPRPSPTNLPAYLAASPWVLPAAIGPAKHARLLPWVKKGSSGLAKRGQPRPRRTDTQAQGTSSLHEPRIDRNEDLIDYTTRYSSYISEPANINLCNLEDQEALSRLSLDHRVTILDEGTDCATILWYADDVKEEERSPSPLHQGDPLLIRSETRSPSPPPQPTFTLLSTDESEEVEVVEGGQEDELAGDSPDGDDSEVAAMLL